MLVSDCDVYYDTQPREGGARETGRGAKGSSWFVMIRHCATFVLMLFFFGVCVVSIQEREEREESQRKERQQLERRELEQR